MRWSISWCDHVSENDRFQRLRWLLREQARSHRKTATRCRRALARERVSTCEIRLPDCMPIPAIRVGQFLQSTFHSA